MDSETLQRVADRVHHSIVPPDTDVHDAPCYIGDQVDFDILAEWNIWDLDLVVEERNPSIAVDHPGLSQAKDVLGRRVRFGQGEGAEQAVSCSPGFLEADAGDLLGGGVDLMIVVAIDLLSQDRAGFFKGGDVLIDTRSDNSVLQPAVGPFDLAFGLGRQGEVNIHPKDAHHLSPLGVDIICLEDMLAPDAIPSLDEAKHTQGVHVVAQGDAIGLY